MGVTLATLAVRHNCELRGDPAVVIDHVATLAAAGPGALAFLANPQYRSQLGATRAAAVVLAGADADACPVACLVSTNPYLSYAEMAAELHPPAPLRPGVAPGAWVAADARIGEGTQVDPGAVIGAGALVGARAYIGAGAVIGAGCAVGDDSRLMARVTLYDGVRVGRRCLVHSGAVIGADGFGIARDEDGRWTKVPQLGSVVIGDDVEIGANTTIDRGAIEDTVLGDGVKLDNQIQIGHNAVLGPHTVMAAFSGVAGSTRVGARCIIGADVGIGGHLTIADDVVIGGGAHVASSVHERGVYGGVIPADEVRRWRRNAARFSQLDDLARRLQRLEKAAREADGSDT
ncbi:MAG: UDP-3-O-(3-hydroxymyristoyl)glucosamine N-acyltransferase [Gammaproteobacteria bacterium]|nr:UDP-3-O-(3-hydroxymyristoyl)glucosamine N-acyltransferase [Gammaproteobacteria bacterium]